jgi:hypothetical protein
MGPLIPEKRPFRENEWLVKNLRARGFLCRIRISALGKIKKKVGKQHYV